MSENFEGNREACILAIMAVSGFALAYYFNPIVACLAVAIEAVFASRLSDGADNGGFGLIFIMSLFLTFTLCVIWLGMKVLGA